MLKCPLYNSLRVRFPSLFHNLVLGNLKAFSQVNHQVGIVEAHVSQSSPLQQALRHWNLDHDGIKFRSRWNQ